jgi:hypothetical protein
MESGKELGIMAVRNLRFPFLPQSVGQIAGVGREILDFLMGNFG